MTIKSNILFRFLLAVIFCINCTISLGQGYQIKQYTVKEGLLDNYVQNIGIDSLGRLLIYSRIGLTVYDGKYFAKYPYPFNSNPNFNTALNSSKIYIDTQNSVSVDEARGFLNFKHNKFFIENYDDSLFWKSQRDGMGSRSSDNCYRDRNDHVYFYSTNLWYFDRKQLRIVNPELFQYGEYVVHNDQYNNVFIQSNNKLYLLESGKIKESINLKDSGRTIGVLNKINENYFFTVRIDDDNRIVYKWNVADNKLNQLFVIDSRPLKFLENKNELYLLAEQELYRIKEEKSEIIRTPGKDNFFEDILIVNDSQICINSPEVLIIQDINNPKKAHFLKLTAEKINKTKMTLDKEHNIWVKSALGVFKIFQSNWLTEKNSKVNDAWNSEFFYDEKGNRYFSRTDDKRTNHLTLENPDGLKEVVLGNLKNSAEFLFYQSSCDSIKYVLNIEGVSSWNKVVVKSNFNTFYKIENSTLKPFKDIEYRAVKDAELKDETKALFKKGIGNEYIMFTSNCFLNFDNKEFNINSAGPFMIEGRKRIVQFLMKDLEQNDYDLFYYDRLYVYKGELYYSTQRHLFKYSCKTKNFDLIFSLVPFYKKEVLSKSKDKKISMHIPMQNNIYPLDTSTYLYIDTLNNFCKRIKTIDVKKGYKYYDAESLFDFKKVAITQTFAFKKYIYVVTENGVYRLLFNNGTLKAENVRTTITGSFGDHKVNSNNLAFIYDTGILLIDSNNNAKDYIFPSELIGAISFNKFWSCLFDSENHVTFVGFKNIVKLFQEWCSPKKTINRAYLSSVNIIDNTGEKDISNTDSLAKTGLTIKYKQNLKFYFGYSCLSNGDLVKYKVQLQGLDETWYEQQENFVNYKTLPPGNYKLNILACNDLGDWTKTPLSFSFSILPPWYRTWLMYVLYFVFLIVVIVFIVKVNNRRLILKAKDLQNKIDIATKEIILQKDEISQQKHFVEEKQKEIVDSIKYAKRIQQALMTSEKYIERSINRIRNKKEI